MNIQIADKAAARPVDLSERRVRRYAGRYFGVAPRTVHVEALTPDASTRTYFRIYPKRGSTESLIVSLYPAPFNPKDSSFLDVTRLFTKANLPVPKVIDVRGTDGIILQEDLGDCSLAQWLEQHAEDSTATREMIERAIQLIARIQAASDLAVSTRSVVGRLAFDADKLGWELNYFCDHFFRSFLHREFTESEEQAIKLDLTDIATELAARPRVLCHRDFHAMNLMVDSRGALRVIDHQDARMGPLTYDLVPLLVERRLEPVDEALIMGYQESFLEARAREKLGPVDAAELRYEFNLMTVQRQLKATGTFSYQTCVVGRAEYYEKYIKPSVATVLRALVEPGMKEYPALRGALEGFLVAAPA
jgi:N-acetylmuramate 1-kinase